MNDSHLIPRSLLALILVMAMALSLRACGGGEKEPGFVLDNQDSGTVKPPCAPL